VDSHEVNLLNDFLMIYRNERKRKLSFPLTIKILLATYNFSNWVLIDLKLFLQHVIEVTLVIKKNLTPFNHMMMTYVTNCKKKKI
jgi:hypothetical protein